MLISRVHLALANGSEGRIRRCADGALGLFIDAIKTALVEGMSTQKVYSGQVEGTTAGLAAARLKYDRLGSEVVEFLLLGSGLGLVA